MPGTDFNIALRRALRENVIKKTDLPEDLSIELLNSIWDRYMVLKPKLTEVANFIVNTVLPLRAIHSVRFRIKDERNLISKIIRKKIKDPTRIFSADTLLTDITDLIGVRILYLFKSNIVTVNKHIQNTFEIVGTPIYYIREGDVHSDIEGFNTEVHPRGYRSTHYIISLKPLKEVVYAEIQTRTLNEEAWSEVDHRMLYPNNISNPLLENFSLVLNGLSGTADALTSLLRDTKYKLDELAEEKDEMEFEKEKRDQKIKELEEKIGKSNLNEQEKKDIIEQLDFSKIIQPSFDISSISKAIKAMNSSTSHLTGLGIQPKEFEIMKNLLRRSSVLKEEKPSNPDAKEKEK